MSHVFTRSEAYYSPKEGVVDLPIGLKVAQRGDSWVSECGTKVIRDAEVVERFLGTGSVVPHKAKAAEEAPSVESVAVEAQPVAEEPEAEPEPEAAESDPEDDEGEAKAPRRGGRPKTKKT